MLYCKKCGQPTTNVYSSRCLDCINKEAAKKYARKPQYLKRQAGINTGKSYDEYLKEDINKISLKKHIKYRDGKMFTVDKCE